MMIMLGVGVECCLLVDGSPAARLQLVNLSSPAYVLSRRASSPSLTCEKVSSTAFAHRVCDCESVFFVVMRCGFCAFAHLRL